MAAAGPDWLLDLALSPALWLSVALALIYSAAIYGLGGGGLKQLGRDLLAGLAGFALGHVAGNLMQVETLRLGQVQLLTGTGGSVLALALDRLLSRRDNKNK